MTLDDQKKKITTTIDELRSSIKTLLIRENTEHALFLHCVMILSCQRLLDLLSVAEFAEFFNEHWSDLLNEHDLESRFINDLASIYQFKSSSQNPQDLLFISKLSAVIAFEVSQISRACEDERLSDQEKQDLYMTVVYTDIAILGLLALVVAALKTFGIVLALPALPGIIIGSLLVLIVITGIPASDHWQTRDKRQSQRLRQSRG